MKSENPAPAAGRKGTLQPVWLCADDFALNDAVSEAILTLLAQDRLSMTSCMTQAARWPAWGARLRAAGHAARAGLHFNLTEPLAGITAVPLGKLMLRTSLRLVDRRQILATLRHQLDDYESVMGCAPTYVDGHQHVHVFPMVRDVLLDELTRRYTTRPWLRNVAPPQGTSHSFKLGVILAMGGTRFTADLARASWPHNAAFAGLYGLQPNARFPALMQGWLASLRQTAGGLIMCHPALRAEAGDVIGPARAAEYAWLSSDAWPATLAASGMALALNADPVAGLAG